MLLILIIAILGMASAFPQASYGSDSFTYWGCGSVNPTGFGEPIIFPAGQLTPDACKITCSGHMFAAVSPAACRCGDDPTAIVSLDEKKCDNPCTGDPNSPICGGLCPDEPPEISNVFVINPVLIPGQEPVSASSILGDTSLPLEDSSPTITDATETVTQTTSAPSIQEPPVTSIPGPTPADLAPPPMSSSALSEIPISSLPNPPTLSTQSSSSTSASDMLSAAPNLSPSIAPTLGSIPLTRTPSIVSSLDPPAGTWQASTIPSSTQTPPSSDSSMPGETVLSGPPSAITWWPEPSNTPNPGGPPVPSQITISDSHRVELRFLAAFWEALFIVAVIF